MKSDSKPLSVLITNITLASRSGTEIVVRDLALGLLQLGHRPIVYSPIVTGPIPKELRAASIPVTDNILSIEQPVDIIHGHHTPTTAIAIARFPHVPAVFACHDFVAWHDSPPPFAQIRRFIAVDEATFDRLTVREGAPLERTRLLFNAVDLHRHVRTATLPDTATRALLIAKGSKYTAAVTEACRKRGMALETIGPSVDRIVDSPEAFTGGRHIVFASARGALEAIASGCAVIVCDDRGLAGMVSTASLPSWRPLNFGLRSLRRPVTVENLLTEIDQYNAADATAVSDWIRENANLDQWLSQLVGVYREAIGEAREFADFDAGFDRSMAHYLELWSPRLDSAWPWMEERRQLMKEIEELKQRLARGKQVKRTNPLRRLISGT